MGEKLCSRAQLLAAAGYPNGFECELACLNFSPWTDVALQIKSDLAQVGINVKLNQIDASRLSELIFAREYQMFLWDWLPDYVDPDCNAKAFAHSDSAGDDATIKLSAWEAKYVNLETSKLVDQAAQESDNAKRAIIYKQIADRILEDGPFAILYTPKKQYGIRLEVRELLGIPSLLWSNFPVLQ